MGDTSLELVEAESGPGFSLTLAVVKQRM